MIIEVSMEEFICMVAYAKKLKSTFMVFDPYYEDYLYGFIGEDLPQGNAQIGCLKRLVNDHPSALDNIAEKFRSLPYHELSPSGFVIMSKDIIAVKNLNPDSKISINIINISDRYIVESISITNILNTDKRKKDGDSDIVNIQIPVFKPYLFISRYRDITYNLQLVDNIDITNDPSLRELVGMKACQGAGKLSFTNLPFYIPQNILGINKNDCIFASHTNEDVPRICIRVIKKEFSIDIIFRVLNLI